MTHGELIDERDALRTEVASLRVALEAARGATLRAARASFADLISGPLVVLNVNVVDAVAFVVDQWFAAALSTHSGEPTE